jgi:hypothetical protein
MKLLAYLKRAANCLVAGFFQQFGKIKRLRIARNRKVSCTCTIVGHDSCAVFVVL